MKYKFHAHDTQKFLYCVYNAKFISEKLPFNEYYLHKEWSPIYCYMTPGKSYKTCLIIT